MTTLNALLRVRAAALKRQEAIAFWKTKYREFGLQPNSLSFQAYAEMFCALGEPQVCGVPYDPGFQSSGCLTGLAAVGSG